MKITFLRPSGLVSLLAIILTVACFTAQTQAASRRGKHGKSGQSQRIAAPTDAASLEAFVERCKRDHRPYKLSLNAIAREWDQAVSRGRAVPDEVRYLHGFTWFFGYIVDQENNDVVLLGIKDPRRPLIDIDCLHTAILCAYSNVAPGCSLDSDPDPRYQKCRIIPEPLWKTRWADVMIRADYDMKLYCQGKKDAHIKGFKSNWSLGVASARRTLRSSSFRVGRGPNNLNRFWFNRPRYPVDNTLAMDDTNDFVILTENPVVILTEHSVSGNDKGFGTGLTDPQSERWARSFTKHMNAIAKRDAWINELLTLYRLLDLMDHAVHTSGWSVAKSKPVVRLVTAYNTPYSGPPLHMPTSSRKTKLRHQTGNSIRSIIHSVRGGVQMPLSAPSQPAKRDVVQPDLKRKILENKPD
jgi:hypothetical protein